MGSNNLSIASFLLGDSIGEGSYAHVYPCRFKTSSRAPSPPPSVASSEQDLVHSPQSPPIKEIKISSKPSFDLALNPAFPRQSLSNPNMRHNRLSTMSGTHVPQHVSILRGSGPIFALKMMTKKKIVDEGKVHLIKAEQKALRSLNHPLIVRLHNSFQDKKYIYLVLDLCVFGDLNRLIVHYYSNHSDEPDIEQINYNDRTFSTLNVRDEEFEDEPRKISSNIRKPQIPLSVGSAIQATNISTPKFMPWNHVKFYFAEVVEAVQFVHSKGYVHRDIKPQNVLIHSSGHIKLTDFGTVKDESLPDTEKSDQDFVGSADYVSPEILNDETPSVGADLWSLGILLYHLSTGETPFHDESEHVTYELIQAYIASNDAKLKLSSRQSSGAQLSPDEVIVQDLINKLVRPKPADRLGAANNCTPIRKSQYNSDRNQPAELLAHSFFSGLDFGTLHDSQAPEIPLKPVINREPMYDGSDPDWMYQGEMDELDQIKRMSKISSVAGTLRFFSMDTNNDFDGASVFSKRTSRAISHSQLGLQNQSPNDTTTIIRRARTRTQGMLRKQGPGGRRKEVPSVQLKGKNLNSQRNRIDSSNATASFSSMSTMQPKTAMSNLVSSIDYNRFKRGDSSVDNNERTRTVSSNTGTDMDVMMMDPTLSFKHHSARTTLISMNELALIEEYKQLLERDEKILAQGMVKRKNKLLGMTSTSTTRAMLYTSNNRLLLFSPNSAELKEVIEISADMICKASDDGKRFDIIKGTKTISFTDIMSDAKRWVTAIQESRAPVP